MEEIIDLHLDFYHSIKENDEVISTLRKENIKILDGFIRNIDLVRRYYQTVYQTNRDRIVLCGINPGKLGAGKTGVPFLDFKSISQIFSDVRLSDQERSAQYMWSVINKIGIDKFYKNIYITNISWFGFTKEGNNLNYYQLPRNIRNLFTYSFIEEMKIVQPKVMIPLGREVESTLQTMVRSGDLTYPIATRLPHPFFSSIGSNTSSCMKDYLDTINFYL